LAQLNLARLTFNLPMPKSQSHSKQATTQHLSFASQANVTVYDVKSSKPQKGHSTRLQQSTTDVDLSSGQKGSSAIRTPNPITIEPVVENTVNFDAVKEAPKRKGKASEKQHITNIY
jgi:hypothetical protein